MPREALIEKHVRVLVGQLKDTLRLLVEAPADAKAAIYNDLGVTMTYHPDRGTVVVEALVSGEEAGGNTRRTAKARRVRK